MTRKTQYDYYDDSFKATAVELGSLPGVIAKDVANVLNIHPIMLYRWKKELREGLIVKQSEKGSLDTAERRELARLKKLEKEHELLKEKHDILKKSIRHFSTVGKKSSSTSTP
jgi:transposase-like protein